MYNDFLFYNNGGFLKLPSRAFYNLVADEYGH